ncbi:unnamed protein product [Ceratitis capitata]|uniref:(Mediterranean fruit fly) hypothetical protein n=1 Tax=Ceratitis capitata TaxID=7213 RepID=A0A811UJF5_CERCA|nr:unnamed protein product [Ceratitis capitata]
MPLVSNKQQVKWERRLQCSHICDYPHITCVCIHVAMYVCAPTTIYLHTCTYFICRFVFRLEFSNAMGFLRILFGLVSLSLCGVIVIVAYATNIDSVQRVPIGYAHTYKCTYVCVYLC